MNLKIFAFILTQESERRVTHCTIVCGTSLRKCTKHVFWVTWHTLHNRVWHDTREMSETLFLSDVSHIAQSCVTRHGTQWAKHVSRMTCHTLHNHVWHATHEMYEAAFSSDVSHRFVQCETHRSGGQCFISVWHVIRESVSVHFLSDVSHCEVQSVCTSFAPLFV